MHQSDQSKVVKGYRPPVCGVRKHDDTLQWRVWAPYASSVQLVLDRGDGVHRYQMKAESEGYYFFQLTGCGEVQTSWRYGFCLDDGPVRPDPYSRWQPDGVHSPSAFYFPEDYVWSDQHWTGCARKDLVIYELHVGTFTPQGSFAAIEERLAALRTLGITAIELLPIGQFPGERNWGYDGVYPFAAQHSYGGPHALQRLVDAAHAEGIAVILDVVLNHLGPEGNYIQEFGSYFSTTHLTPWGQAFNFDGKDAEAVRAYARALVWQWIHDFHIDGLRLDAVHAMFDQSEQHILNELKQCADQAAQTRGGSAVLIAESLVNDVTIIRPQGEGGYGLDAEWNEDLHHAVYAALSNERSGKYIDFGELSALQRVWQNGFHLDGIHSKYRNTTWGASAEGICGSRFVASMQNHDHIGNRAFGERFNTLLDQRRQRLAACCVLLSPFIPMIFMGEEYAEPNPFLYFVSFDDPRLPAKIRRGRKRDYGLKGRLPDPQSAQNFHRSILSWSWPSDSFHARLRLLYEDLLRARACWPPLQHFSNQTCSLWPNTHSPQVVLLDRRQCPEEGNARIRCCFNFSDEKIPLSLLTIHTPEQAVDVSPLETTVFRSESARYTADDPPASTELLGYECVVLANEPLTFDR